MLKAINSTSSPSYAQVDSGSARCRMSLQTLREYVPTGRIGSVVRIKVGITTKKSLIALCTIWPDASQSLSNGYICLDSTVQVSTTSSSAKRQDSWVEGDCEILEVIPPPRPCTSIKYRIRVPSEPTSSSLPWNQAYTQNISPACFYGLPLQAKCTIQLKHPKGCVILVNKTNPSEGLTVGGAGLIVTAEKEKEISNKEAGESSDNSKNACQTKVVLEIINRVIDPVLNEIPNGLQFKGIMLLGPPGGGKSYSLKVVKQVCSGRCQVEIIQVSIPELLAEDNSLKRLEQYLHIDIPAKASFLSTEVSSQNLPIEGNEGMRDSCYNNVATPFKFSASSIKASSTVKKKSSTRTDGDNDKVEKSVPKVIFLLLDEIDALGHPRNHNETQIAIKERICQWFDLVNSPAIVNQANNKVYYCMVASSNRAEDIDIMFRRGGRLEHEINVMNTQEDRSRLFLSYLQGLDLLDDNKIVMLEDKEKDIEEIARYCAEKSGGYVAADIASLIREVALALKNGYQSLSLSNNSLEMSSSVVINNKEKLIELIEDCMKSVPPSCLRGITVQLPSLTLDDVIGCHEAKKELTKALSFSSPKMKEKLAKFGMNQSLGGVLLYGPPGNSKTRLITAAAATHNLPLISLSSADIYSAYVGDAEAEIRKAFTIARQAAPCILFFDEMDSLVTNRAHGTSSSSSSSGAASVEARVLSTFLNEMDGVNTNAGLAGVIVIGATNRIDCIDAALIRKGRFYQTIYIPPPNAEDRLKLLEYFLIKAKLPLTLIDQMKWRLYEGISGAQIENLCKEEAMKTKLPSSVL